MCQCMIRIFIFCALLFCASICLAQDSFFNPNSFRYSIDSSSEYPDGLDESEPSCIDVIYDFAKRISLCTITINGNIAYSGKILDKRLDKDNQMYLLENFFQGKYNGYMSITRGADSDNIKVAMIYYANQHDEISKNTCICLLLTDIDRELSNNQIDDKK